MTMFNYFKNQKERNFPTAINLPHQITTQLHTAFEEMTQSYFFLKTQQFVFPQTHEYEIARKLMSSLREHRIVLDSQAIQIKLEKQLQMAENHDIKTSQTMKHLYRKADLFSYLKAPSELDSQECIEVTSSNPIPALLRIKNTEPIETNLSTSLLIQMTKSKLATAQINLSSKFLPVVDNLTCFTVTAQSLGRKKQQEDTMLTTFFTLTNSAGLEHKFLLTGVFDGHGGTEAALHMQKNLSEKLQETFPIISKKIEGNVNLTDRVIWNALKLSCVELSEELNKITSSAGTTATFSLIKDGEDLWHATIGDSRSFIASKEKRFQLSEDMVIQFNFPENTTEEEFNTLKENYNKPPQLLTSTCYEKSIRKRGGFARELRVNGLLIPARDIGSGDIEQGLSARPKITKISLSERFHTEDFCFLVHASDGLWDRSTTNQISEVICQNEDENLEQIATNIVYSSLMADGFDNTSIVIVKLDLNALRANKASRLSTGSSQF